VKFLHSNHLALVFGLGKPKTMNPIITNPVAKHVYEKSTTIHEDNNIKAIVKEKMTVIFNNDSSFLKNLWGDKYIEIEDIFNSILQFSWLPHNYIDNSLPVASYYTNEIFENYLDKPLILEMSDVFRSQFGWKEIVNPNEKEDNCKKLISDMFKVIK
jgi:hypothetical protein